MVWEVENLIASFSSNPNAVIGRDDVTLPKIISGDQAEELMLVFARISADIDDNSWIIDLLKQSQVTDFTPRHLYHILNQHLIKCSGWDPKFLSNDILAILEIFQKDRKSVAALDSREVYKIAALTLGSRVNDKARESVINFCQSCGVDFTNPQHLQNILLYLSSSVPDGRALRYILDQQKFFSVLLAIDKKALQELLINIAQNLKGPASLRQQDLESSFNQHLKQYGAQALKEIRDENDLKNFLKLVDIVGFNLLANKSNGLSQTLSNAVKAARVRGNSDAVRDKILQSLIPSLEQHFENILASGSVNAAVAPLLWPNFILMLDCLDCTQEVDRKVVIDQLSLRSVIALYPSALRYANGPIQKLLQQRINKIAQKEGAISWLSALLLTETIDGVTHKALPYTEALEIFRSLQSFLKIDPKDERVKEFFREKFEQSVGNNFVQTILHGLEHEPPLDAAIEPKELKGKLDDSLLERNLQIRSVGDLLFLYDAFPSFVTQDDLKLALKNENFRQAFKPRFQDTSITKLVDDLIAELEKPNPQVELSFIAALELIDEELSLDEVDRVIVALETKINFRAINSGILYALRKKNPDATDRILDHYARSIKKELQSSPALLGFISIKGFFSRESEEEQKLLEARLLERLGEREMIVIYHNVHEENKKFIREKVGEFCKKHGLGLLLFNLNSLEKLSDNTQVMLNLHEMRDALNLNAQDLYLSRDLIEISAEQIGAVKFIEILLAANADKSNGADVILSGGGIEIGMGGKVIRLIKVKDITLLLRLFPEIVTDREIEQIAQNSAVVEAINSNLAFYSARYVDPEALKLFKVINEKIPPGERQIPVGKLLSVHDLIAIKKSLPKIKKKPPADVASSNVFRSFSKRPQPTFQEFYQAISPKERQALNLFVVGSEDFLEVEKFLKSQLEDLRAQLAAIPEIPKEVRELTDEERANASKKRRLQGLIQNIRNLEDPDLAPEDKEMGIISALQSFTEEEREKFPSDIDHFYKGLRNIENTKLVSNEANWGKFLDNIALFKELGCLSKNANEFFSSVSACLSLVTQANCSANLSINLQGFLDGKRYKDPRHAAFSTALFESILPFLNSAPEVIMEDREYEAVFAVKSDIDETTGEVIRTQKTIYFPLPAFLYLVGDHFAKIKPNEQREEGESKTEATDDDYITVAADEGSSAEAAQTLDEKMQESAMEKGREIFNLLAPKQLLRTVKHTPPLHIGNPQNATPLSSGGIVRFSH